MDFDPSPGFAKVRAPVLALWGADEECVPRPVSRDRWAASGADVTLVDLPGCGHWPVVGSGAPGYAGWDHDRLAGDFTATVAHWLLARNGCATTSPARGWTGSTTPATSCKRTPRPSS
jgi:pimeloyl-ACP methyl ester carboxylesterase